MKLCPEIVTKKNIIKDVSFVEFNDKCLEHLYAMFNEVMTPVM
jgi:hypothetical protein